MLVAPSCVQVERVPGWWARVGLLVYAVQNVTNTLRHSAGRPLPEEKVRRALPQGPLEGARGHYFAAALLRSFRNVRIGIDWVRLNFSEAMNKGGMRGGGMGRAVSPASAAVNLPRQGGSYLTIVLRTV